MLPAPKLVINTWIQSTWAPQKDFKQGGHRCGCLALRYYAMTEAFPFSEFTVAPILICSSGNPARPPITVPAHSRNLISHPPQ
jgi:hypothetical protein